MTDAAQDHQLPELAPGLCAETERAVLAELLGHPFGQTLRWAVPAPEDGDAPAAVSVDPPEVVFKSDQWHDALRLVARVAVNAMAAQMVEQLSDLNDYRALYGPLPRRRTDDVNTPERARAMRRVLDVANTMLRTNAPWRADAAPLVHEALGTLVKMRNHVPNADVRMWTDEVIETLVRGWFPREVANDAINALWGDDEAAQQRRQQLVDVYGGTLPDDTAHDWISRKPARDTGSPRDWESLYRTLPGPRTQQPPDAP